MKFTYLLIFAALFSLLTFGIAGSAIVYTQQQYPSASSNVMNYQNVMGGNILGSGYGIAPAAFPVGYPVSAYNMPGAMISPRPFRTVSITPAGVAPYGNAGVQPGLTQPPIQGPQGPSQGVPANNQGPVNNNGYQPGQNQPGQGLPDGNGNMPDGNQTPLNQPANGQNQGSHAMNNPYGYGPNQPILERPGLAQPQTPQQPIQSSSPAGYSSGNGMNQPIPNQPGQDQPPMQQPNQNPAMDNPYGYGPNRPPEQPGLTEPPAQQPGPVPPDGNVPGQPVPGEPLPNEPGLTQPAPAQPLPVTGPFAASEYSVQISRQIQSSSGIFNSPMPILPPSQGPNPNMPPGGTPGYPPNGYGPQPGQPGQPAPGQPGEQPEPGQPGQPGEQPSPEPGQPTSPDVFTYNLTADPSYGYAATGTLTIEKTPGTLDSVKVSASIQNLPRDRYYEGWLKDNSSGATLSLGAFLSDANGNAELKFEQQMLNSNVYTMFMLTEESQRDTNPSPSSNLVFAQQIGQAPDQNNGSSDQSGQETPNAVKVVDFSFSPATLYIKQGTTVTWTNEGKEDHSVTSSTNMFDSGTLKPGQEYSMKFNNPGTYEYYCKFHSSMRGAVIVTQ